MRRCKLSSKIVTHMIATAAALSQGRQQHLRYQPHRRMNACPNPKMEGSERRYPAQWLFARQRRPRVATSSDVKRTTEAGRRSPECPFGPVRLRSTDPAQTRERHTSPLPQ